MYSTHVRPLLIRADASTQIGVGHVMRCLALAQAWQHMGGTSHVAAVELPDGLATRLATDDIALHRLDIVPGSHEDATQTAALAHDLGAAWVVEDGYHFGTDYQHTIKEADLRLLAIDDYSHAGHYVADLVLNQNIYADTALYPNREPTTRLLLGTRYVLLRREFWRWRVWQRRFPSVARKVLVTLGGGDPDNVTFKVIQALQKTHIEGLEAIVVVGVSNPHLSSLQAAIQRSEHRIHLALNVVDMSIFMAWADIAVTAGGSTCWELAFMGLPTMITILAQNQQGIAEGLDASGVGINLGWHTAFDESKVVALIESIGRDQHMRELIGKAAHQLVDGTGGTQVVANMLDIATSPTE